MKLKRGEPLIQKQDSNHIKANITIWKIWRNNVLFLILNRKNQLLIDEAEERKAPHTKTSSQSYYSQQQNLENLKKQFPMYCILILILEQYSTDV